VERSRFILKSRIEQMRPGLPEPHVRAGGRGGCGVSGLLFHECRRSAIPNLVRRAVSDNVAMMISGHETRAVFDRYNITSERDLQEASAKIEAGKLEISRDNSDITQILGSDAKIGRPN
jgi:hypothetical protein